MGFATLPNQVHRKSVKKGFDFTLMVAGQFKAGVFFFIVNDKEGQRTSMDIFFFKKKCKYTQLSHKANLHPCGSNGNPYYNV